jgi:hypothetical protein
LSSCQTVIFNMNNMAVTVVSLPVVLLLCASLGASAFVVRHTTTTTAKTALPSVGGVIPLSRVTGQSQLDPLVIQKYLDLPMPEDTVLAEYVWVDAVGNTRSKTRTLPVSKVSVSVCVCFSGRTPILGQLDDSTIALIIMRHSSFTNSLTLFPTNDAHHLHRPNHSTHYPSGISMGVRPDRPRGMTRKSY